MREKKIAYLFLMIILFICILRTNAYAQSTITNWQSLKESIEDSPEKNIEINLSREESNTWIANSTISIKDKNVTLIADNEITITRGEDFTGAFISNNGTLTILTIAGKDEASTIIFDGNNIEAKASAIKVSGGTLNLSNVTIQNNKNTATDGGGILANNWSKVKLDSTEIKNNETSGLGGGIFITGILNIEGNSKIQNNKSTKKGGGIYVSKSSTMKLTGNVEVFGNETIENDSHGGGIFSSTYTTLEIKDKVKINGNIAKKGSGGGIYSNGTIKINGINVEINDNTAGTTGGGITIMGTGTAILENGKITGNKAETHGGAVRVDKDSNFIITGGEISGNKATLSGGGIYSSGALKISGEDTKINGNTAGSSGGGITITGTGTAILENGKITGNKAGTLGGAIRLADARKISYYRRKNS